jgi:hypothetical protein
MKKSKKQNFIYDGYTAKGYCKETDLNEEFRFEYRPMLTDKRVKVWDVSKFSPEMGERKIAAEMVHHVISWDVVDEKGNPVPITASNLLKLVPSLWSRLCNIVAGFGSSDIDPKLSDEEQDEAVVELLENMDKTAAELGGADAKN